jgi:hypothetical protein
MKVVFEIPAAVLKFENSIHIGNYVVKQLTEKNAPIAGGIFPVIDASKASGTIEVNTRQHTGRVFVTAIWIDKPEDDDEL